MKQCTTEHGREVFARNLAYYIKASGKTQNDVAHTIRISAPTMSNYVSGKIIPRIDKMERLAKYFGIAVSDLLEDKKIKPYTTLQHEWYSNFNGIEFTKEEISMIITFTHFLISRRGKGQ